MAFIDEIKNRAKQEIKTIVLPESYDDRTLKATSEVIKQDFAKIILIGNKEQILKRAKELDLNNIDKVEIVNPQNSDLYNEFVESFYELRKHKNISLEKAKEIMLDNIYFGMMMVKHGYADGLVSGAVHSTSDTLRPALQILKTAPGIKLVSAFFMMVVPNCTLGENGVFLFSDCGLNENPDSEVLSEIAIASSNSFKLLTGKEPKIAMLSYSTHGSAKSELTNKVIEATNLVKQKAPNLLVDGELQLDAAIIPEVAEYKAKGSPLKGRANILIFPDLNSGNIGYKLVQRLANAEAYGPLCQGISKPVNDLSRGCTSKDIEGVIAITAVQAQEQAKI